MPSPRTVAAARSHEPVVCIPVEARRPEARLQRDLDQGVEEIASGLQRLGAVLAATLDARRLITDPAEREEFHALLVGVNAFHARFALLIGGRP